MGGAETILEAPADPLSERAQLPCGWFLTMCGRVGRLGNPLPRRSLLLHKVLCTISGGLGPWIKYLWEAPRTFVPLLVLYFNKVFSRGRAPGLEA